MLLKKMLEFPLDIQTSKEESVSFVIRHGFTRFFS